MEVICVCGIIACVVRQRPERAARRLFDIYRNQQERGRSGFGYAMSRNGSMSRKRVQKQGDIFGAGRLLADLRPGDCVLVHHRLPTSTFNIAECNHPIANEDGSLMLIHNGIIANAEVLREMLVKKGHIFETEVTTESRITTSAGAYTRDRETKFTDSEVLVHLLEERKGSKSRIRQLARKVYGSYALAWLSAGSKGIRLFRRGNPVKVFRDRSGNLYAASEMPKKGFTAVRTLKEGEYGILGEEGYARVCTCSVSPESSCCEMTLASFSSCAPLSEISIEDEIADILLWHADCASRWPSGHEMESVVWELSGLFHRRASEMAQLLEAPGAVGRGSLKGR